MLGLYQQRIIGAGRQIRKGEEWAKPIAIEVLSIIL
jgi:hypothetical protein